MSERPKVPDALAASMATLMAQLDAQAAYNASPEGQAANAAREAEEARLTTEKRAKEAARAEQYLRERLRKAAPIANWERAWSAEPWPAVKAVDSWIAGGCQRHLFLFGGVGCGKSVAAAHAVKYWLEHEYSVVGPLTSWLRPNEVVSAVMHAYADDAPKLGKYIVIDDLGFETKEDFSYAMTELLDRQDHKLLVTCNLTAASFRERYTDPRLMDRLNDCAMAVRIHGESKRRKDGGF